MHFLCKVITTHLVFLLSIMRVCFSTSLTYFIFIILCVCLPFQSFSIAMLLLPVVRCEREKDGEKGEK